MDLTDITRIRLSSQQISVATFKTPADLVGWMGAMQAQNYPMAKWAVGLRLSGLTDEAVETAIDKGEIIRTHVLRPTWHLVSAKDIHWMLKLTAPKIKASLKSRHKQLELTESVFTKSNKLIEKALANGRHLTRDELKTEFDKAKIATGNNRMSHLLLRAELDGIICSGATRGKKQTYALLSERAPQTQSFARDEALATLARRYFSSHGPATSYDFAWWSGLPVTDARRALEMVKPDLISETIDSKTYWLADLSSIPETDKTSVHLLPAFDEFIISYKDRSATLALENHKKVVSQNGIFWPVIVINGQVAGLWKRTIKKDKVRVSTELFQPLQKTTESLIEKTAASFGNFLEKKTEIIYNPK